MFSWFKRIIVFITVLALAIAAGLFALTKLYEDDLTQLFTQAVNKNLTQEVKVSHVGLNLFANFPRASISLDEISVGENILSADVLYLNFSLLDLLKKQIAIETITVKGGLLQLVESKSRGWNFEIWKTDTSKTKEVQFNLAGLHLSDCQIFLETQSAVRFKGIIKSAEVNFDTDFKNFDWVGNFTSEEFKVQGEHWLSACDFSSAGNLTISQEQILWQNAEFNGGEISITANGSFDRSSADWQSNISSDYFNLPRLTTLPFVQSVFPENLQREGRLKVNGSLSNSGNFNASLDFDLRRSAWQIDTENKVELEKLIGNLGIEKDQTIIAINEGRIAYQNIKLNTTKAEIINSKHALNLSLSKANITNSGNAIYQNANTDLRGNLTYNGAISLSYDKRSEQLNFKQGKGTLGLNNFIDQKNPVWKVFDASVEVDGSNWETDKSKIALFGNELEYSGGLIFNENMRAPKVKLRGYVEGGRMDLAQFERSGTTSETDFELEADLDYYFKEIHRGALILKENLGRVSWDGKAELNFTQFKTQVSEGNLQGDVEVALLPNGSMAWDGDVKLDGINLNQLFADFENFGQQVMRSEYLEGKMDADLKFFARLDKNFSLDPKSLEVQSNVLISKGKLIDFPLLQDLAEAIDNNLIASAFINNKALANAVRSVEFGTLKNQISLHHGNITIPKMGISSDVFDLNVSGRHDLDQQIEYHLDFLLADVLRLGKEKSSNSNGKRLFIVVTGTTSDPIISVDREAARAHRKSGRRSEPTFEAVQPAPIIKPDTVKTQKKPESQTPEIAVKKEKRKRPNWLKQEEEEKTQVEIDFSEEDL